MNIASDKTDIERLFSTGAHFAQVKSRRHPSMKPYIVGAKGRQEIIDLEKTAGQIKNAQAALEAFARDGKTVLFVGGKTEIAALVKRAAESVGAPFVATRWLGGTISNWQEIKKRVERFAELTEKSATGALAKQHTKLEIVKLEREKNRLESRLDGVIHLTKRPDALMVVDTKHEKHAVKEANDAGIPLIAIMSSDCDLTDAAYPIVANDSSRETVRAILDELTDAFKKGKSA